MKLLGVIAALALPTMATAFLLYQLATEEDTTAEDTFEICGIIVAIWVCVICGVAAGVLAS